MERLHLPICFPLLPGRVNSSEAMRAKARDELLHLPLITLVVLSTAGLRWRIPSCACRWRNPIFGLVKRQTSLHLSDSSTVSAARESAMATRETIGTTHRAKLALCVVPIVSLVSSMRNECLSRPGAWDFPPCCYAAAAMAPLERLLLM